MKQLIFNNWNILRFMRLAIGVAIIVQGVISKDVLFSIVGIFIAGTAVFNAGCCGKTGCDIPGKRVTHP
jgi:hypothetical protein